MTFAAAYAIACSANNPTFEDHDTAVIAAKAWYDPTGKYVVEKTPCLIFSVDDEYFYYGFDGCCVAKGKCNKAVSDFYRRTGFGLKIR